MDIVYFVLGSVTALLVLGVVAIVKVMGSVKDLNDRVGIVETQVSSTNEIDELHRRIDNEIKDISSGIDSRLDKMQNKIKQKDLLNG